MNHFCKTSLVCTAFFIALLSMPVFLSAQQNNVPDKIDKQQFSPASFMWYNKPASQWDEALPVGNGRLGAMVYGKTDEEIIQFNEDTYWSGGPYSTVVKGGYKDLPAIQRMVFDGHFLEAHNLFGRSLMGYPVEQQKYQSLANLHLLFPKQDSVINYKRWINLEDATTGISYSMGAVNYQREIFSSAPDQVIVIRLTADHPGSINFSANLRGVRNQTHSNYATDYFRMDGMGTDALQLTGKSADYMGIKGQLKYKAVLKAVTEGGTMHVDGYTLTIKNANAVTLYIVAATNFVNYKDVSANVEERIQQYLLVLKNKNYAAIRAAHVQDHQQLFARVKMQFPNTANSFLPTDERLKKMQTSDDPQLAALCYQFGRYLLIASSRKGTQATNLQGIWNNDMNPSWDAKYTTNINTQMNYWPVESANLSECGAPLFDLVKDVSIQGAQVAREHYGSTGWVLHQNTDIWRVAAPMDGPTWGTFTVGGAWLTNELWERYLYSRDLDDARALYPILKGSVDFFMNFLVKHPNGKWLLTNPSTSPENFPGSKNNGPYFDEVTGSILPGTTICAGSSIDMQIITDLFNNYEQASALLHTDMDYAKKVATTRKQLVPPQINKEGALQEWADDWPQLEKNHRHFSHLYGLYPGNVLSAKRTPEFVEPIKAVLNQRGDEGAGFSRAWKICLWARLYDGERTYKIFKGYLKDQTCTQLFARCFKPMQVDGSLGVTAGITEMLLQSHEGYIDLLPALPKEWPAGVVEGICARGGFQLDFAWENDKLLRLKILSKAGGNCKLNLPGTVKISCNGKTVEPKVEAGGIISFSTQKGAFYEVSGF